MTAVEHYDVVLVQPGIIWVYDPFEHLGLAYLASSLRAEDLTVKILDAVLLRWRMSDLAREIDRMETPVLGVTLVSHGYEVTERWLRHYRERHPGTKVVAGGHFATFAAEKIFAHTDVFDAIVLGEGERPFSEYCLAVARGEEGGGIPDVAYPGQPVRRSLQRITDMDALPFPARDNLQLALERGATASVTASRGCYARCSFCTVASFYEAKNGPRWMGRSIDNVIVELELLHDRTGIDHFMFVDDNFMGPGRRGKERAIEFARAYERSGLPMTFHVDMRAMDVDEAVLEALVSVGLRSIFIGIESVAEQDLTFYRKDLRASANWEAVRALRKFNIEQTLSMIMFNPQTTPEAIQQNCAFLTDAGYFPRNPIMILNIYEGTEHARQFAGKLDGPFWDYRFDFDDPRVKRIYDAAREFSRETVELERELSRRGHDGDELRLDVHRARLENLEDLARTVERGALAEAQARSRARLELLWLRAGDTSGRTRLYDPADDLTATVGAAPGDGAAA